MMMIIIIIIIIMTLFQKHSKILDEYKQIVPYSDWAFLAVPGWGGGGGGGGRFLKTIKDIDMKLTPLIKRREINLLLLS